MKVFLDKIINYFIIQVEYFKNADVKERNRILILIFFSIFILDYLMFCYIAEKNIFNIFPRIIYSGEKNEIEIYLPSCNKNDIIVEKRKVPIFEDTERYVKFLFKTVEKGSIYKNTSASVPFKFFIRKIWLLDRGIENSNKKIQCIIDIEPELLQKNSIVIKGSENLFKKAVELTIIQNIPSIKHVKILEKGIPDKNLWEL